MWVRLARRTFWPRRVHARHGLVAAGVAVGLILAIGAATLVLVSRRDTIAAADRQLTTLALVLAEETDRGFQAAELLQLGLIRSMRDNGVDTPEEFVRAMGSYMANQDLTQRVASLPQVTALSVVDARGKLVNQSRGWPVPDVDLSDREFFSVLSRDPTQAPFIGAPIRSRIDGSWTIPLPRAFIAADGRLLGFVDIAMDLAPFEQFYSRISAGDESTVSLFRRDGVLLARFPHVEPSLGKAYGRRPEFADLLASTDREAEQRTSMIDGLRRLSAPRSVAHFPVVIAVTRTMRAVLATWWRQTIWLCVATGFTELVLGILVLLGVRRLRDQGPLNGAYAAALEAEAGRALAESELVLAEEREQSARDARRQALRFDTALNNMKQALMLADDSGCIDLVNRRFGEFFNISDRDVSPGMTPRALAALVAERGGAKIEDLEAIQSWHRSNMDRHEPCDFTWELSDGRVMMVNLQPIEGGWVATYDDVTEQRRADARIAYIAQHDALTDLPNRRLFRERLEQALAFVRRGRMLALLYLDLDQFKGVNDTLGHPIGDALLQAVAQRLREHTRETDIVARLGGDEFAIVQTALDRAVEAGDFAERLISLLETPFTIEGHQIIIGTSIGIAFAPQDGADPDTLLKNADLALYRAKQDGRGVCRMFQTDMDAAMQVRRTLELDLRLAQRGGQLELYFQPLINLRARGVGGFEALLRWRHPERGLVSPAAFIPLAEEIGVIVPMGEWVVRRACATAAHWPGGLKVAVNLSPVQFKSRTLVEMVAAALRDSGLAPERLELEITETVMLQDTETTLATLHALHGLGVRIALDDFGTGYSSLSYLRRFPFDRIKIDQSFVRELGGPRDCSAIVRAVVQLSRDLGMATTAEGVETREQLRMLAAAGCTDIQGYLFSRPVPGPAIRDLLRALPSVEELLLPPEAVPREEACLVAP